MTTNETPNCPGQRFACWCTMYMPSCWLEKIRLTLNADINKSGKIEPYIGVGRADDVLFAWLEIEPLVVSGCVSSAGRSKSEWLCSLIVDVGKWCKSGEMLIACLRDPPPHPLVVPAWQKETNQLAHWTDSWADSFVFCPFYMILIFTFVLEHKESPMLGPKGTSLLN